MNYLKYTQYIYLAFCGFFIFDAVSKHNAGESAWISLFIAAVSLFMFFFRRKFAKKFENRKKNS